MGTPIVYVSHFRIKSGHTEEWRQLVDSVVPALDRGKPRTAFQHFYTNETETSVSIVHIFPDRGALDLHMEGADSRTQKALEFLEPVGFELYGQPTESLLSAMGELKHLLRIEPTHMAGYDRL